MTKTKIRFFTISDYAEEEKWLREQHKAGWRLISLTAPCLFKFEQCTPEDVVYRLDFKNNEHTPEYMQMCRDFGWEHIDSCLGWLYFRKPASRTDTEGEDELFSDNASKAEMVFRIFKRRMVPLCIVFFCCLIPNMIRVFSLLQGSYDGVLVGLAIVYAVLFLIYDYLLIHCGIKLRRLKKRFEENEG